jgi:hypothetical protein
VLEEQPRVDDVEGALGQGVGHDVVLGVGDVRRQLDEVGEVDVGGEDLALWADLVGEPRGDRPGPGGHLEAAPAARDADLASRRRVAGSKRSAMACSRRDSRSPRSDRRSNR